MKSHWELEHQEFRKKRELDEEWYQQHKSTKNYKKCKTKLAIPRWEKNKNKGNNPIGIRLGITEQQINQMKDLKQQGKSNEDIAGFIGCSISTVAYRLNPDWKKNYYRSEKGQIKALKDRLKFKNSKNYIFMSIKRNAKSRGKQFNLEEKEFYVWYNNQAKICEYCNRTEEETKTIYKKGLALDRKDNNIGYEIGNLALSCLGCNVNIKGNFWKYEDLIINKERIKEFYKKEIKNE